MNNLENNGESLLRDKLLQHEFAADERDWEKMDELLAIHPPPTPPLAPSSSSVRAKGLNKWLIGLALIGLAAWWLAINGDTVLVSDASLQPVVNREAPDQPRTPQSTPLVTDSGSSAKISPTKEETALAGQPSKDGSKKQLTRPETKARQPKGGAVNTPPSKMNNLRGMDGKNPIRKVQEDALVNHSTDKVNDLASNPVKPSLSIPDSSLSTTPAYSNTSATDTMAESLTLINDQNAPVYRVITRLPQRTIPLRGSQWQPRTFILKPSPPRTHRIQAGVVGGAQAAYVRNNPYDKIHFSPTLGLSANYQLTSRWAVQADVMYRMVPYYLRADFTQSRLYADGQYNYWQHSASGNDLEFFEVALLAKRTFFNHNVHLNVGLRPAFVRPIHTNTSTSSTAITAQETLSAFNPSIRDGVRRLDLALAVGADLRLWRNLWIDVRANQGLFDLTYDDFFQNTNTDPATDAQITLRYYFFAF